MRDDQLKKKLSNLKWGDEPAAKILVADDEEAITEVLKLLLEDEGYQVLVAYNGKNALEFVKEQSPDLIISDVNMPGLGGFELCQAVKQNEATRLIPFILLTATVNSDNMIRGIEAGADDFISKPFNALELTPRVRSLLRVKTLNSRLENFDQIILAFTRAVEARDPYTRGHSERVGKYAVTFAERLGLNERYGQLLFKGAILHDIGKIGISDSILLKKEKLTYEEFEEIKKHPEIGMKICAPLKSSRPLMNIVLYHHERMDGTGYPYGLMAEEIPIEARIIGIADVFDAMTSARPYRPALRQRDACEIMRQFAETHFDQDLLPVFLELAQHGDLNPILEETGREPLALDTRREIPEEIIKHLDFFDGNLIE